jgi:arylsulfatase A-like enzyme
MKTNAIVILIDEHINYKYLPKWLTDNLKGYQSFKKLGIEFQNIHCNRTVCSSSRSCIMSGEINNGIQDNIDQSYQYNYIQRLDSNSDIANKQDF